MIYGRLDNSRSWRSGNVATPDPPAFCPEYEPNPDWNQDERLSKRELEVLCYLTSGLTDNKIAEYLDISALTASTHVKRILCKLAVSGRVSAAVAGIERGIIRRMEHPLHPCAPGTGSFVIHTAANCRTASIDESNDYTE